MKKILLSILFLLFITNISFASFMSTEPVSSANIQSNFPNQIDKNLTINGILTTTGGIITTSNMYVNNLFATTNVQALNLIKSPTIEGTITINAFALNVTNNATISTVNATSTYLLNGNSINNAGILSNLAYKNQDNIFTIGQTIQGNVTANTLNTGQGQNELYAMDQAVRTTDEATFATLNATSAIKLNNVNINSTGTLSNVAYKGQDNAFNTGQTISGTATCNAVVVSNSSVDGLQTMTNSAGTTKVQLNTNGSSYFTGGNFGVGTTAPLTSLEVVETVTSSPRGILSSQYSTGIDGARVGFIKARGTLAAPTTIVTGDTLGRLMFRGYDGTNYLEMASIEAQSSGTISSTRIPTQLIFSTSTDAAPSVLTERMKIDNAGLITITGNMQISGTATANKVTDGTVIITGGNLTGASGVTATTLTGTLQTASQPNITSLGTLSSLTISGITNIGSNLNVTGNLNSKGTSSQLYDSTNILYRDTNATVLNDDSLTRFISIKLGNVDRLIFLNNGDIQSPTGNLQIKTIKAYDSNGLLLAEDGGKGITISDSTGKITLSESLSIPAGNVTANILSSDVSTGTPPVVVTSTTLCPNLNAGYVDGFHIKSINIGDWNMDADRFKTVAHGMSAGKILSVQVFVINDTASTTYYNLSSFNASATSVNGYIDYIDGTNILIERTDLGDFNSVDYDSTSYNRGRILITYTD